MSISADMRLCFWVTSHIRVTFDSQKFTGTLGAAAAAAAATTTTATTPW